MSKFIEFHFKNEQFPEVINSSFLIRFQRDGFRTIGYRMAVDEGINERLWRWEIFDSEGERDNRYNELKELLK